MRLLNKIYIHDFRTVKSFFLNHNYYNFKIKDFFEVWTFLANFATSQWMIIKSSSVLPFPGSDGRSTNPKAVAGPASRRQPTGSVPSSRQSHVRSTSGVAPAPLLRVAHPRLEHGPGNVASPNGCIFLAPLPAPSDGLDGFFSIVSDGQGRRSRASVAPGPWPHRSHPVL